MSARSTRLLRGATVLTCDPQIPSLQRGDILIDAGRISAVGTDLVAPPGSEVVDLVGSIVIPGLIDAHQHLWEHTYLLCHPELGLGAYFKEFVADAAAAVTPDGLYDTVRAALRSAVTSGTTTTFDWCHVTNTPEHAQAAVAAALSSPSRYVFGYGPPVALGYYNSARHHPNDMEKLAAEHGSTTHERVSVAAALRGPDLSPPEVVRADIERARQAGIPISMHVSTHVSGPGGVTSLHEQGLLGPDLQFVHLTDASTDELRLVSNSGGRIVVPPIAELAMGTGVPPLRRVTDAGSRAALAVDTVLGSPLDMFNQMRAAAILLRAAEWDGSCPPVGSRLEDILAAATIEGARACWLDDVTGSLTPGKWADLVILEPGRPVATIEEALAHVVWNGSADRISTVLVGGVTA
ncbi:amidohydrolase family protein [Streptomyces sp. NPDC060205]|uniref:amidohydrolase family protein n=1 Tax=Streptomyces sp. NPDC060205 TaxID=3347072 RepID=UPI003651D7DF